MLAGAHVPDVARPLAVAGEAGRGQGVERHALDPGLQSSVWDLQAPEQRLERPDVEVLAGVAGRHERELLAGQVELAWPPAASRASSPNGLTARPEVDEPVRVAERAEHPAGGVDLDDVAPVDGLDRAPLRTWRTRTGGGAARVARALEARLVEPRAVSGPSCGGHRLRG